MGRLPCSSYVLRVHADVHVNEHMDTHIHTRARILIHPTRVCGTLLNVYTRLSLSQAMSGNS